MYGAGYIEGYLTHDRIWETFQNYRDTSFEDFPPKYGDQWPAPVLNYMVANEQYVRATAKANRDSDPYWLQIAVQIQQFDGLLAGYNKYASEQDPSSVMNSTELWLLNSMGDMDDLNIALFLNDQEHVERLHANAELHAHCTGLVKGVRDTKRPGFTDVFVAQDAWSSYTTMNRIHKSFELPLKAPTVHAHKMVFASYPGVLFSNDDFYVTDTQMVVIETTFHCWRNELYAQYITPSTVLTWMRAMAANRLAVDGQGWYGNFSKVNSGTYNNQYMVIDHKLFDIGMRPKAGFVWAIEQMPGLMIGVDRTQMLIDDGFVPSINVPSIYEVYAYAGYPEKVANTSDYWSYNESARMKIIRRDQAAIETFDQFNDFMRYNNWKQDPLTNADPAQTISSRYDLRVAPLHAASFGGTDSKTANHWNALHLQMNIIAGPTRQAKDEDLPAWSFSAWEAEHGAIPHRGIPDGPWPKERVMMQFEDFGLGHHMSILAIIGIAGSVVGLFALASWMGWSLRRKQTMPAFHPELVAAETSAQGAYAPIPSADPIAADK
eukprot:GAFH01000901.1.p2 GENE.GAFH01000901.1~~GAFH01000901.1.p2  ORF type:complete len:623 (-),score=276.17 GAFH01000901.1:555-2198(-)